MDGGSASVADGPCSGVVVLDSPSGRLQDGTGLYLPNMNCTWRIEPVGAAQILLSFSELSLESGYDYIIIQTAHGSQTRLSGTVLPDVVSINGGSLLVQFVTDSSVESAGFVAVYTSLPSNPTDVPHGASHSPNTAATAPRHPTAATLTAVLPTACTGTESFVLSDDAGTFSDGDGVYGPNVNCTWLMLPTKATRSDISRHTDTIVLSIIALDIESGYDMLKV